jgi:hypothetical protein
MHRFEASAVSTLGGQQLAADAAMLGSWLETRTARNTDLETVYVRRFTADYRQAFDEWLKTDPLKQSVCTAWAGLYARIQESKLEEGRATQSEAAELFTEGTEAREKAGKCVRHR